MTTTPDPMATRLAERRAARATWLADMAAASKLADAERVNGADAVGSAVVAAMEHGATDATAVADAAWSNGRQHRTNMVRADVRRTARERSSGLLNTDDAPVMIETREELAARVLRVTMTDAEPQFSTLVTRRADGTSQLTILPMSPREAALASDGAVTKADDGIGGRAPGRSGTGWRSDHAAHALRNHKGRIPATARAPREQVRPWRGDVALVRETSLAAMMDPTRNHYANHKGSNAYDDPTGAAALADRSILTALADHYVAESAGRRGLTWCAADMAEDMGTTVAALRPWVAGHVATFRPGDVRKRARSANMGAADMADAWAAAERNGDGFAGPIARPTMVADYRPARNAGTVEGPAKAWHLAGKVGRGRHGRMVAFATGARNGRLIGRSAFVG